MSKKEITNINIDDLSGMTYLDLLQKENSKVSCLDGTKYFCINQNDETFISFNFKQDSYIGIRRLNMSDDQAVNLLYKTILLYGNMYISRINTGVLIYEYHRMINCHDAVITKLIYDYFLPDHIVSDFYSHCQHCLNLDLNVKYETRDHIIYEYLQVLVDMHIVNEYKINFDYQVMANSIKNSITVAITVDDKEIESRTFYFGNQISNSIELLHNFKNITISDNYYMILNTKDTSFSLLECEFVEVLSILFTRSEIEDIVISEIENTYQNFETIIDIYLFMRKLKSIHLIEEYITHTFNQKQSYVISVLQELCTENIITSFECNIKHSNDSKTIEYVCIPNPEIFTYDDREIRLMFYPDNRGNSYYQSPVSVNTLGHTHKRIENWNPDPKYYTNYDEKGIYD